MQCSTIKLNNYAICYLGNLVVRDHVEVNKLLLLLGALRW